MTRPVQVSADGDVLLAAAVGIINRSGVADVTLATLAVAAGVPEAAVTARFSSPDQVFAAIVTRLGGVLDNDLYTAIAGRRSLTESLQIALAAYWQGTEGRIDEVQAVKNILLYAVSDAAQPGTGAALFEQYIAATERWLTTVADVQHVTWALPVRQLAHLMLAVVQGTTTSYLFTRDSRTARAVLEMFGFELAQHGLGGQN